MREPSGHKIYEFGDFRLETDHRMLYRADQEIPLAPKAVETLLALVHRRGEILTKDELLETVWPDAIVEESNLFAYLSVLRKTLGTQVNGKPWIETLRRRGYRFSGNARLVQTELPTAVVTHEKNELAPAGAYRHYGVERRGNVLAVASWTEKNQAQAIKTMAVLPFKPLVPKDRDEALEFGIAEALISKLNSNSLKVYPFATVRRFGSLEQDPLAAGRELGVESVLDGHVQISGDKIRISVQLLRVADGQQLSADRFDQPLADIFRLQDSITSHVAHALQVPLGAPVGEDETDSPEAYQLYMRGRFHMLRLVLPEVLKAITYYERAIEQDPNYTLAYVWLTHAYRSLVLTNDFDPADVMPKAKIAASRAVEANSFHAQAHVALGNSLFWYEWDWQSAEQRFLKAIELDPKDPSAHLFYAQLLSYTGRFEVAIEEARRARELEPVILYVLAIEGQILTLAGRHQEALEVLLRAIEMEPKFWLAHMALSRLYADIGMYDKAITAGELAGRFTGGNAEAASITAYSMAKSGKRDGALDILAELETRAVSRYVPAYALATIYNALGDKESSLKMLERSCEKKDLLIAFLKVEPKWNNLCSEPRFIEILRKIHLD